MPLSKTLADKLTAIASEQLSEGLRAKRDRMKTITEILDLYNNKTVKLVDQVTNIPFPILAGQVDLLFSKIDNPPQLNFKIPNKQTLSEKIKAAWVQESSSTKSGWSRKDRAAKKMAMLTGRAIEKVYASNVNNKYQSHYDVVDTFSFVADPMHGFLEDSIYHGETDIFKTKTALLSGAKQGFYNPEQVKRLANFLETEKDGDIDVVQNKFDRLSALGVDVQTSSFAGQTGSLLTEWIMRYEDVLYYLFFEPKSRTWVRAEKLKDVFKNNKTPYVSWATHFDQYSFWTKGPADDSYPLAEAMRLILNNAIENEKRRTRPMRIVDAGALVNINELQDFIPDNVIVRNPNKDPNIITVETPETTSSINLATFFDQMIQNKSGVADPGVSSADPKVGIYYGRLQQEADRVGVFNKEYSESYAHKGYRFFWGLKQFLTAPKQLEMLGKSGVKLQELSTIDFKDVDDVDDVIVSGGSLEAETTAVEQKLKTDALTRLASVYPNELNASWVIRETLKSVSYTEDEIMEALDKEAEFNRETIEEADEAIQSIMLGKTPELNMAADVTFANRILDYARENINYVKLDKQGKEAGVDKAALQQFTNLLAYANAHQKVIQSNMARKQVKAQAAAAALQTLQPQPEDETAPDNARTRLPSKTSPAQGTPQGTASASRKIAATFDV